MPQKRYQKICIKFDHPRKWVPFDVIPALAKSPANPSMPPRKEGLINGLLTTMIP